MTGSASEKAPVRCTCGRLLTNDLSKQRGLGRRCWEKLHGRPAPKPRRPAPKPRRPAPAPEASPGQTELPLYDHQPTLWSA